MKNRNWFWGLFFLLSAVLLVFSQIGSFEGIGILSILAGVLLASMIIHSLFSLNYFGIFVPLAFLYMLFGKLLGLPAISPWLLVSAGVLTSIGFSILFHTKHHHQHVHCQSKGVPPTHSAESIDDNNPQAKVHFGSSSKYLHTDCLKSGQFTASFGELEVFFDQAQLSPEGCEVFIDCHFGAMKLYIPKNWRVVEHINASLGSVENITRTARPDENSPCLTLTGNVHFGGVEIHYV